MSSIFSGMTGLRTRYTKVPYTTLVSATNKATAVEVIVLDIATRYIFIDNKMDEEVTIYLVNPDVQGVIQPSNLLLWFQLGSGEVMNQDQIPALGMEIDPGTRVYMSVETGTAPTTGYVKILAWG